MKKKLFYPFKNTIIWAVFIGLVVIILFFELAVLVESVKIKDLLKNIALHPINSKGFILSHKALLQLELFTFICGFAMFFSFFIILITIWYISRVIPRINRAISIQRESYLRYKFFAEAPPTIGIIRFELTRGIIKDINRTALNLLRRSRGEVIGKSIKDFILPNKREFLIKEIQKLKMGQDHLEFELALVDSYGQSYDLGWHIACPTLEKDDEKTEALAFLTDISERKRAEAERLEKERLKGVLEMAGAAAHELNQPIQIIMGLLWRLEKELKNEEKEIKHLKKLKLEVERMAEIGNKISNISSYKVKDYVGDTKIVDIDKAIQKDEKYNGT